MDAVDEEIITRLCYALELDKLYTLPDLGLGADIVDKMWILFSGLILLEC